MTDQTIDNLNDAKGTPIDIDGGTLTLTNSAASTYDGTIQDGTKPGGAVFVQGQQTLTQTGTNTFTGGLTVAGGTLVESGTGAALGGGAVPVVRVEGGATLALDSTAGAIFQSGVTITGAGTISVPGTGIVTLGTVAGTNGDGQPVHIDLGAGGLIDVENGTLIGGYNNVTVYTGNVGGLTIGANATFDGVEADVIVGALTGSGTLQGGYPPGDGNTSPDSTTIGEGTATGDTALFSGTIQNRPADANGNGGVNNPLVLVKDGDGTQVLSGTNTFTGGTTLEAGTLDLESTTAGGTGGIAFDGADATLLVGASALNGVYPANVEAPTNAFTDVVTGFAKGDTLDLGGFADADGKATATLNGTVLTVGDATDGYEYLTNFTGPDGVYAATTDNNGGTDVTFDGQMAPTITNTSPAQISTKDSVTMPFTGATITDPNSNSTDMLTITLSGGNGGTLSDGSGFAHSTLMSTDANTYTLTGTGAAITAELDQLSFAPSAGDHNTSSTTTFTLSDVSTIGGASNTDTTSMVTDNDPAVVPTVGAENDTVVSGMTVKGTGSTGALAGDTDPNSGGTLSITSVTYDGTVDVSATGTAQPVAPDTTSADGTVVDGTYGELTIGSDGSYTYTADQGLGIVTATDGQAITDVFGDTVTSDNGANASTSAPSLLSITTTLAPGGTETVNDAGTNSAGNATYTIGATTLTLTNTDQASTYGGTIQDGSSYTGGSVAIINDGRSTLTLTGANTYTGGTAIEGGTLSIDNLGELGTGGITLGAATTDTNGTLQLTNGTPPVTAKAAFSSFAVAPVASSLTIDQAVALTAGGGTVDVVNAGADDTLSGIISDAVAGTAGTLTKTGAGTLTLTGANTYTGGTTLAAGTLELDSIKAAGSSAPGTAGSVAFAAGTAATLRIDVAGLNATSAGSSAPDTFANTVTGFAAGDTIDLAGLDTTAPTATLTGTTLTVGDAADGYEYLTGFVGPQGSYRTSADPAGTGTDVTFFGPAITSETASPTGGDLNAGKTVTFTLATSEPVTVITGAGAMVPTLMLSDGETATYAAGSNSASSLAFVYTVAAGDTTSGAQNLTAIALNLNGSTVQDAAGNPLDTSTITPLNSTDQIDTMSPAVTETLATNTGGTVSPNDTSDGTVTGSGDPGAVVSFTENGTGRAATTTATADTNGTYTYTPTGLTQGSNTIVASETDAAGNTGTASLTFTYDTVAPAIASESANSTGMDLAAGSAVTFTIGASEAVDTTNSALALSNGKTAAYASGSGTNTLSYTYTVAAGDTNTADLQATMLTGSITDNAGNPLDDTSFKTIDTKDMVDTVPHVMPEPATVAPGRTITGTALAGDSDPNGGTLSITEVSYNKGASVSVAPGSTSTSNPTTIEGTFGTLTIGADGSYSYGDALTPAEGLAVVTAPAGPITDTFADTVMASEGTSTPSSLAITTSLASGSETVNAAGANGAANTNYTIGATTLTLTNTDTASNYGGTIQDGSSGYTGGSVAVTNDGTKTLTLTGTNTYTGGTTIVAGTLVASNTGAALGTANAAGTAPTVAVAAGATLDLDASIASFHQNGVTITGTGTITKTGTGEVFFGGGADGGTVTVDLAQGGALDVEAGTLAGSYGYGSSFVGNQGNLDIAAGATFDGVEGAIIVGGLNDGTTEGDIGGTLQGGYDPANPGSLNGQAGSITIGAGDANGLFSGVIQNRQGDNGLDKLVLIKEGAGTQVLSGTNTFTGGTTLEAGTLDLESMTAGGTGGIAFDGAAATLLVGTAALNGGYPANAEAQTNAFTDAVTGFAKGDTLDLGGFADGDGKATATLNGTVLSVYDPGTRKTEYLTDFTGPNGVYAATTDNTGGTDVTFAGTMSPTITNSSPALISTKELATMPFTGATITDPNSNSTDTLTITLSAANGTLSDGTGYSGLSGSGKSYTLNGTGAAITTELNQLSFTPNVRAANTSTTTTFTLSDTSTIGGDSAPNATSKVTDNDPAVAPTIAGTKAGQTTTSEMTDVPFSTVTVADTNAAGGSNAAASTAIDTLTIALSGGAGGTLSDGADVTSPTLTPTGSANSYTLTGTGAQITAELDKLNFMPTTGAANTSSTTTFTLSDKSSAFATATTDSTTTVVDIDPAVPPAITGTKAGQTTTFEAAVTPFSMVTVADANAASGSSAASTATDTLTISLGGAGTNGGGQLSGIGLTQTGDATYTLTGTGAAITAELDKLKFTPNSAGGPGHSATTPFTLTDVSSAGTSAMDTTTTVIDSDPAAPPTLAVSATGDMIHVTGTGNAAGDTVTLYEATSGGAPMPIGTTTVGASPSMGTGFTFTSSPTVAGTYGITATETPAGGTTASAPTNTSFVTVAAPTITSEAASLTSAALAAGGTVTFTLDTSAPVTQASASGSSLGLNDGGTASFTSLAASGAGDALTYTYTVAADDASSDLQATALNGPVTDTAGNALTGFTAIDTKDSVITTAPTITSETAAPTGADLDAGKTVTFTLDTSAPVTQASASGSSLGLNDGGTASFTSLAPSGAGDALTYTYTVSAGDTSSDLQATALKGTITDAAGNALTGFAPIDSTDVIDTTKPVLTVGAVTAVVQATSSAGAAVNFPVTAADTVDGSDPVTYTSKSVKGTAEPVQSGATFSLGTYDVTASAVDKAGNQASPASFTFSVADVAAPSGSGSNTPVVAYNDDGSLHDVNYSGFSGKPYTSYDVAYAAGSIATSATYSDGEVVTYNTNGSVHDISNPAPAGADYKAYDITFNADGTHDISYTGIINQLYKSYDVAYGSNGKPSTATYSNGEVVTYTDGNLHDISNPASEGAGYASYDITYNTDGSLHDVMYSGVTSELYTSYDVVYDANGKPTTATYSNGRVDTYDPNGSVHDISTPAPAGSGYTSYDTTLNADGSVHDISYSGFTGQPYSSYDVVYGGNGNPTRASYSSGEVVTYNTDGSLHDISNPGGAGAGYSFYDITYNADGSAHDVNYIGISGEPYTSYDVAYDGKGNPTSATYSDGEVITYDANGSVHDVSNPAPAGADYKAYDTTFDTDGTVHDISYTGFTGQLYASYDVAYGSNGKPSTAIYSNGEVVTYNTDGSLHDISNPASKGAGYASYDITYNADGSLHDVMYSVVTGEPYMSYDVVYDANGKPSSATYSDGVTDTYDSNGNVQSVSYTGATGSAPLKLTQGASYTGGTTLGGGTLELAAAGAAGSGTITFAGTATLTIDAQALTAEGSGASAFTTNTIAGATTVNQVIDLTSLAYVANGTSATLNGSAVNVTNGTSNVTLNLASAPGADKMFVTAPDKTGGTLVYDPPSAPSSKGGADWISAAMADFGSGGMAGHTLQSHDASGGATFAASADTTAAALLQQGHSRAA